MAALDAGTNAVQDIGLRELVADFARARLLILGAALVGALLAAVLGILSPDKYEARVVAAPNLEERNTGSLGGLSSLASEYSGLAALAGISLGGGSKKDEAVAILKSELLTSAYIREQKLLPVLFAGRWDAQKGVWRKGLLGGKDPTVWRANQFFDKQVRRIVPDSKTGLIVLSIRWTDPAAAAKWANDLVARTNQHLRTKAIEESVRNIRYLNEQAKNTEIVEARRAINSLLEQEINKEMLARGREEYALKVIDPAVAPEKPATMSTLFLTVVGFVVGAFFAVLGVFGRRALFS
jgi:uncharacterized protein involved in exopolysaccharide biosynthesis